MATLEGHWKQVWLYLSFIQINIKLVLNRDDTTSEQIGKHDIDDSGWISK